MNSELERISSWLSELKFKRKLLGGVDEIDVWEKIDKLNEMYEEALKAERIRYDSLLKGKED